MIVKKYIASFIVFVIAFAISLIVLHFAAQPDKIELDEQEALTWHGQVDNSAGTYNGELVGDIYNGKGYFKFLSGETYAGNWKESNMSGNGVTTFPKVGEYTGEMSESKRNGEGAFKWLTGETYTGNWHDDKMSGKGKYTFANGAVLEGEFFNNKPSKGTLSYKIALGKKAKDEEISSLVYTFSETEKHIVFTTKGGLNYDGDISGLFDSGKAKITYPSGNKYEGELFKGKRNGEGKYHWKSSSSKKLYDAYYEGKWKSDNMNGKGTYHFSSVTYPYLTGTFEKGKPSGTLTYYKEEGNTFETVWENGKCTSVKET